MVRALAGEREGAVGDHLRRARWRSAGRTAPAGSASARPAGWCCGRPRRSACSPRRTGIASTRTGTSSRHSGSPSRAIRPSRSARRAAAACPAGDERADDVVDERRRAGRGAHLRARPVPRPVAVRQPQHQVGEADRSAMICQSATSSESHSTSSAERSVWAGRELCRGTAPVTERRQTRVAGTTGLSADHGVRDAGELEASLASMTQAPAQPTPPTIATTRRATPATSVDRRTPAQHAVAVAAGARRRGRCSRSPGAHVFPMYDGAVTAEPPMRILDVRHEQTAAFAAEAMGKLTRTPGLAVLTAGPGCHQRRQRRRAGPVQRLPAGRGRRPGAGQPLGHRLLQELDQPPIVAPVSKLARTIHTRRRGRRRRCTRRSPLAGSSHRGPVFVDVPMDEFFNTSTSTRPVRRRARRASSPTATRSPRSPSCSARRSARCWCSAPTSGPTAPRRPRSGSSRRPASRSITNGMGRGVIPGGHPLLVTKARGAALGGADLVVVAGTPARLPARLRRLRRQGRRHPGARRTPRRLPRPGLPARRPRRLEASGDLTLVLDGLRDAVAGLVRRPDWSALGDRAAGHGPARPSSATPRCSPPTADPIHPARIYGELVPRLAEDAIVIGDGGDFVSFAGKFVEPKRPGGWLDPGPYGCLGAGLGRGDRRPPRAARPPRSCCCTATAPPACR